MFYANPVLSESSIYTKKNPTNQPVMHIFNVEKFQSIDKTVECHVLSWYIFFYLRNK